jgi:hypothetical protein
MEIVHREGMLGMLSTYGIDSWGDEGDILRPQDIERVFRKTDLKDHLALFFGGRNFTVSVQSACESKEIDGLTFYPTRYQVMLNYFPYGVPERARKELGKAAVKYAAHVPSAQVLAAIETRTDRVIISDGKDLVAKRRAILGPEYDL